MVKVKEIHKTEESEKNMRKDDKGIRKTRAEQLFIRCILELFHTNIADKICFHYLHVNLSREK